MAISWPKERRLIGTDVPRVDGPDKATGHAKYSYDINRPGMLHALMLRCPHAHAKLTKIDTSAAEKMPGFKAIHLVAQPGKEFFYAGDEIAGLAADTEEHAHDALRAIKVEYEVLEHVVREEDALENTERKTVPGGRPNLNVGNVSVSGNVEDAFKNADGVVEGTYGVPVICHQCLEAHGLVAEWTAKDELTVWCSTQAVPLTAQQLAGHFQIATPKVKCITHYMGGGFGSKFGPDIWGLTAAHLAKKAGAPVKLMLDREEEMIAAGQRPSGSAKVKIAGTKDGKITAFDVESYSSPGIATAAGLNLPYVYPIANVKRKHTVVRLNAMAQRAYRAPGHPQSCYLTECPIDDLAAKLGLDPLQLRLKNLPPRLPQAPGNDEHAVKVYADEIAIAAKLSDWEKKWHPPGKGPGNGPVKHGMGMALHTWGGAAGKPNEITVTISSDGSVLVQSSTQDLGTGERTVLPLIVAEILGLNVKDIAVRIGESPYGPSSPSGGSTTCPGTAPPTLKAALVVRDALFEKLADRLKVKAEDLTIEPGKIVDKAGGKKWEWKEACARLGMDTVQGRGIWDNELNNAGLSKQGVGGVQIAEVLVDTETGVVRCTHIVAVQDCGLVINKLCCESQVAGGVIMAVNAAVFEERIMDRRTGRQVNPDMEFYKLGGIQDIPRITVHMHDMPERGVIGIGEPPTISALAAIGNAVHNAIGVRVPNAPFTPERVLAALAKGGKA
jgi:xanthine dehydrogenase YagR molybdenum-binding subunit